MAPTIGVSHGTWALPPAAASVGNVLVVTGSGIYLYDLADDSWTTITPSPDPAGYPGYQSAASSGDHFWTIHGPADLGLRHSADAGATWEHIAVPGTGDGSATYITIYNEVLYMGYFDDTTANDGIYRRASDGSGGWTAAYDSGAPGGAGAPIHMVDVANSDRFWFGETTVGFTTRNFAYIDGGTKTVVSGLSPANPSTLGVATIPDNEPVAFGWSSFETGSGGTHAYKFNDNAYLDITPAAITTAAFGDGITGIDARDVNLLVLNYYDSVGDDIYLYRSTDGGGTWTQVATYAALSAGPYPTVVWSRLSSDLVVASLRTRIAWSTDGGATWTESSAAPTPQIAGMAVLT
jgi:photosystem II stability/assembly factor-like uncharacterized protein